MGLVNLVDGVGQLAAAPVFQAVDFTAIPADGAGVAFNHAGNLFGLVRMNQEYDFVMSHTVLLTGCAALSVQQGETAKGPREICRCGYY